MLVKAIDWFESSFIPKSDAMERDCSVSETEECSEKRKRLKTLACVPLLCTLYFVCVMSLRRKVEFMGNAVLCVLHAILLRQTANQVREQTIDNSNHAEQVCTLFAILFWSKAYASLYSFGGEAFEKSKAEAIADSIALVLEAYTLYVSGLAFRRLSCIYALHLVQFGKNDKNSTARAFEVDKHGNWHPGIGKEKSEKSVDVEEQGMKEKR
jgi:hypothetical protein